MPKNKHDYSEFSDATAPAEEAMAALRALVDAAVEKELQIAQTAELLKKQQEEYRELTWQDIPALLDEMGLEEIKTPDGLKIVVKEKIDAGIAAAKKAQAFSWLEANGHAALIKRKVSVSFSREQEEQARELVDELGNRFKDVEQDAKVHPATLKAWVKEMLAEGRDVPLDLFGVHRRRIAEIKS